MRPERAGNADWEPSVMRERAHVRRRVKLMLSCRWRQSYRTSRSMRIVRPHTACNREPTVVCAVRDGDAVVRKLCTHRDRETYHRRRYG